MTTTEEVPMPATYPYVERLVRIFRDRVGDDTSAIVLLDFARAYADARCAELQAERDALAEKVKAMEDELEWQTRASDQHYKQAMENGQRARSSEAMVRFQDRHERDRTMGTLFVSIVMCVISFSLGCAWAINT